MYNVRNVLIKHFFKFFLIHEVITFLSKLWGRIFSRHCGSLIIVYFACVRQAKSSGRAFAVRSQSACINYYLLSSYVKYVTITYIEDRSQHYIVRV